MSRVFVLVLGLVVALPAAAQRFQPSVLDLTAGGTIDPEVACAVTLNNIDGPLLIWFDAGTESIYDALNDFGSPNTFEILSAEALDAAAGVDVDGCRDAVAVRDLEDSEGFLRLYLVLTTGDTEFVASVTFQDINEVTLELITTPESGAGDGVVGIALAEGVLYAAVRDDLNDPPPGAAAPLGDGFYTFAPEGEGQTASLLALDGDLSLTGLETTAVLEGAPRPGLFNLLAISDGDGAPPYNETVVALTDPTGSPTIEVFVDPLGGLLPFSRDQGRLVDVVSAIEIVTTGPGANDLTEGIFVLADGPDGVALVRYPPRGTGQVSATQASIEADLGPFSPGYAPNGTTSLLYVYDRANDDFNSLLLINSSEGGGADEVLLAQGAFVTPTEPGAPELTPATLTVGPNPFVGRAVLEVGVAQGGPVAVRVVDVLGREVAEVYRGPAPSGTLRLDLEAGSLPAGRYVVVLEDEGGRVLATAPATVVR